MTEHVTEQGNVESGPTGARKAPKDSRPKLPFFRWIILAIFAFALLATGYWLLVASDRYVSESNMIIRKTDAASAPSFDFSMLFTGVPGLNRADQLLLREYLLSVDILKKLDEELDLRAHYSLRSKDIVSRMWSSDTSIERFHRHYLRRVAIEYDDFAGVLRMRVQAYDPEMAQAISRLLVREGEDYMNHLGHELAEAQVGFLEGQVDRAQQRFREASQAVLNFQNQQGLLSPVVTAESISTIIAGLETQRAQVETQMESLPRSLDRDHPNRVMLQQSLGAIDRQIMQEKAKLATTSGKTLNISVEQFHRLQMEMEFTEEIYKSSLSALEKGRIDATRMLEKVSVLQAPTLAEYPMQPRRAYNAFVTVLFAFMLAGIIKMLEGIVLDHVD